VTVSQTVINSSERMRAEDEYLLREARKALAKVVDIPSNIFNEHKSKSNAN